MDTRRAEVGRQIKSHRRLAKFRSQRAFAEALGIGESSVANAESGSDRIGDGPVYEAIETHFGWPVGSITAYIAGTGPAPWGAHADTAEPAPTEPVVAEQSKEDGDDWTPEEVKRAQGMTVEEIQAEGRMIGKFSGEEAQIRYLTKALAVRLEKIRARGTV
ncbi:helix-turn-helix transcriptional regulator [Amycolatopsis sp. NPDC051128]|uniref:helix-turn-helix domain-containing protein n=1 Tax=Amycolatopsis sp. NPDC051128 TaxID=3155412 RepID=UPI00342AAB3B